MTNIAINEIRTDAELERVYPVMKALRTELVFQDYIAIYQRANQSDDYTLVGAYEGANCIALMGYRVLHDFVHGKHLYVDDLVTLEKYRSLGVGAKLLKYAEERAKSLSCSGLRLCTGTTNDKAKKFYERESWQYRSVVYKKKLGV